MRRNARFLHQYSSLFLILGALIVCLFSFYLMFHTFSYDPANQQIVMSSHLWSDFGAHIPLIRSFSYGDNWPPQYPLFPGEKIRYHFLFYAIVGFLERIGLRIDYALNIPSAVGFFGLCLGIYVIGVTVFKKKIVGVLGVLFFLFNGTLSFLNFFTRYPLSIRTPSEILSVTQFPSFGPWDNNWVSAFWNLNVYTNQRHLAFSFCLVLVTLLLLLTRKKIETTKRFSLSSFFPIGKASDCLFRGLTIGLSTLLPSMGD